ncbi:unnamed protein product, partial [Laminaria digitata]
VTLTGDGFVQDDSGRLVAGTVTATSYAAWFEIDGSADFQTLHSAPLDYPYDMAALPAVLDGLPSVNVAVAIGSWAYSGAFANAASSGDMTGLMPLGGPGVAVVAGIQDDSIFLTGGTTAFAGAGNDHLRVSDAAGAVVNG